MIILQLKPDDAETIVSLVKVAVKFSLLSPHKVYLLRELETQIDSQGEGCFFQCAACMEPQTGSTFKTHASEAESERIL